MQRDVLDSLQISYLKFERMGLRLHIYFLFVVVGKIVTGDEQHCSRYHYEAQTLERIIRAEFNLETVKNDIQLIKDAMEKDKIENADDKLKFEEQLELVQDTIKNVVINVTKSNIDQEECLKTSSMRQFCTTNATCSDVEDSECKRMVCKCKPGLSYHHGTRKCLSDCGDYGYGNTYQVEMDTLLSGYSTKTLKSISLEDCVNKCTTEADFMCRSAEYLKTTKRCYLAWETLHTNPSSHNKNDDYDIFTRDCKSE